jgi:5-methylcytosine-specific restriction endonuclease McrA
MSKYDELLKDPRWQRKRLDIMNRDNFTCQLCKSKKKTLNVHHKVYHRGLLPWENPDKDLITLCEDCHSIVQDLKGLNYDNASITEISDWSNGTRTLLLTADNLFRMAIFNSRKEFVIGYDFKDSQLSSLKESLNSL